jgi:hypothetical protein
MNWDGDLIIISGTIVTLALGLPLVRAWVRAFEARHRREALQPPGEVTQRLAAIESAVEAIAVEVERISENQRFTTRLLAGREAGEALVPRDAEAAARR